MPVLRRKAYTVVPGAETPLRQTNQVAPDVKAIKSKTKRVGQELQASRRIRRSEAGDLGQEDHQSMYDLRQATLAPQPIHDQPYDPVRTVTPIRTFRYRVDTEERVEHICCLDICLDGIGLDGVVQQFSKCRM